MGWWTDIISGQKLGSSAAAQAASDAADAKLSELNQAQLDDGSITQAQYDVMQADVAAGAVDVNGQIAGAFNEGLKDGLNNELAVVKNPIGFAWSTIPISYWIIGAVALLWWLGGFTWLKRYIARK